MFLFISPCSYIIIFQLVISSLSDDILTKRPQNIDHSQFHNGKMNIIPFYLFIFFRVRALLMLFLLSFNLGFPFWNVTYLYPA